VGVCFQEAIHRRRIRREYGVARFIASNTPAIQHDQGDWTVIKAFGVHEINSRSGTATTGSLADLSAA
jgi:hypothetical protein